MIFSGIKFSVYFCGIVINIINHNNTYPRFSKCIQLLPRIEYRKLNILLWIRIHIVYLVVDGTCQSVNHDINSKAHTM